MKMLAANKLYIQKQCDIGFAHTKNAKKTPVFY